MSKRKARYHLRSNPKKNKGLTLPGYNNLGPFNDLNVPLTKSDADAVMHDIKYGKLGKRSYYTFTQADEDFLNDIENETDIGARIAKKVFKAKKKLSEWNILPGDPLQSYASKNPLFDFHGTTGNAPLTRARKKALERQTRITDIYKKKKPNTNLSSVINLQDTTQVRTMVDGEGSGNPQGLKETPLDKVVDVERGIPGYQYASLPWNGVWWSEEQNIQNQDFVFRMTSPYDCVVTTLKTDKNNSTGIEKSSEAKSDAADTTINKAMWYDYYASLYKYYSVVSCKWSMLIENLGNDAIYVHQMYVNDINPPKEASNLDMLNWLDNTSHYVAPAAKFLTTTGIKSANYNYGWQTETDATTTANSNYVAGDQIASQQSNTLQLSGQYTPGQSDHEIRLDADVENWTAVNTNPKLREALLIRIKPDCAPLRFTDGSNNYGRTLRLKYTIKLEYLVEFKELDAKLRWPILSQPIVVTVPTTTTDGNEPMDEEATT